VERLTVREAGYLRLEAAGVPHSIGWGAVLDHPVADAEQAFASLARQLEGRLHDLPRLRQRVVILPRGCGLPIWVDDADFDLARHMHRAQADADGAPTDLCSVMERLFAIPVDLSRPLWDLWVVTGTDPAGVVIVFRLHHAIADGVGAAVIAAALLAADDGAEPATWLPRLPPSKRALLADNLRFRVSGLARAAQLAAHPIERLRRAATMAREMSELWSARGARTSLNIPVTADRELHIIDVPLEPVRAAGHRHGATINDVLLSAIAEGFRTLLARRGETIPGPLTAALGVSLRAQGEHSAGNAAGGMLVPLFADEPDLPTRLRRIAGVTQPLKQAGTTPAVVTLMNTPFLPLSAQTLFERQLSNQTLVQTYVANIPGPTEPLQVLGGRLQRLVPIVPIMGNVVIGVAAVSYAGRFVIGVRSDPNLAPDVEEFTAGMLAAFEALAVTDAVGAA
jgi:diacylglycerol O-acyltransferase / wax synthase